LDLHGKRELFVNNSTGDKNEHFRVRDVKRGAPEHRRERSSGGEPAGWRLQLGAAVEKIRVVDLVADGVARAEIAMTK